MVAFSEVAPIALIDLIIESGSECVSSRRSVAEMDIYRYEKLKSPKIACQRI